MYSARNDPSGRITFRWLWAKIRKIAVAGESWFVVSLVGTLIALSTLVLEIDKIVDHGQAFVLG